MLFGLSAIAGRAADAVPVNWEWISGIERPLPKSATTVLALPRSFVDRPDELGGSSVHMM
jgi:hypothetical protein